MNHLETTQSARGEMPVGDGVAPRGVNVRALSLLLLLAITVSGAGTFTSEWASFARGMTEAATCRVTAEQVSQRAERATAKQRITPRLTQRGEVARPAMSLVAIDNGWKFDKTAALNVLTLAGPAWRTALPPPTIAS